MRPASRWLVCLGACLLLAMLAWAYWPGLRGPFLFDDYGNLDVIGAHGRIRDWPSLLFYLTSGNADPTGRPVALLTFLLDATHWPAEPWPFKRTNLMLHLINTALLAWVVARLQAALADRRPELRLSRWTPVLTAALWGSHPFFVSTTLYVVQREAMLPMTFVLMALLAWDRAVLSFVDRRNAVGWLWATGGLGGTTLLAGLSKANGFLAPMLVGLAYLYFLRPGTSRQTRRASMDTAAVVCLALPSVLIVAYLLQVGWELWSLPQIPGRDWDLPERLLSEPRAIWTYVSRLALPRAGGGGVYVDAFAASRGWLEPATTLPAMLALAASIGAAIVWRRRFPIASFAWFFFLAAHLLESSTIALELYFEHRNYLPAMFLGWPLAHALLHPGAYSRYRLTTAATLLIALLLLTHERALVWGDSALLGAMSGADQADSARAQVSAARQEIDRGDLAAGLQRIQSVQHAQPGSVDVAISSVAIECAAKGSLAADTFHRTQHTLATAGNWNFGLYQWMQDAAVQANLRHCRGFGLSGLSELVTASEANPQNAVPRRKRDLWHVRGRIALAGGMPELALLWFNAAILAAPDPEYALVQAAALGDAGAPGLGVRHLDTYARVESGTTMQAVNDMAGIHLQLLRHYGYFRRELRDLHQRLQADAAKTGAMPHQDN